MDKIKELKAAFEASTPGEWRIGDAGATVFGPKTGAPSPETVAAVRKKINAEFITLAHNAMPDLLDAVRLAEEVAMQDPITFSDDADIPYRQLAALVNANQAAARQLLEKLQ